MGTKDHELWQLHVRFANGQKLTPEERARLDAWYEEQDQAETHSDSTIDDQVDVIALQKQIDDLLLQTAEATDNIRKLTAENETLRREVAELREKVAQRAALELA